MKKNITAGILTLAMSLGFAQEAAPEINPKIVPMKVTSRIPSIEKTTRSFGYLKMGVGNPELDSKTPWRTPGLGVGYRINSNASAIDISASFNHRRLSQEEGREETYHYTLPKVNYLYYFTPKRKNSFYTGGGLAWGGVLTKTVNEGKKESSNFHGLIPNAAIGYEINRLGALCGFMQFDVSHAAIAAHKNGSFPKPFAELCIGAGF